ncbi:MAG: hypothetical protein RMJ19_02010 [Gemmatales bacterium]|nr:hypothetical protein [Gemmatales bacterium]MDW8174421.1 hypothetical protein [Gemmatales bacterium]
MLAELEATERCPNSRFLPLPFGFQSVAALDRATTRKSFLLLAFATSLRNAYVGSQRKIREFLATFALPRAGLPVMRLWSFRRIVQGIIALAALARMRWMGLSNRCGAVAAHHFSVCYGLEQSP